MEVSDGDKGLALGTDYAVEYQDNINAGTAKAIVTGSGNYTGTVTKTFTIEGKNLKDSDVSLSADKVAYTGEAHTPKVTVSDGSKTLVADTDYAVTYQNNIEAGTAVATVSGKGNYKEIVTKTFIIEKKAEENLGGDKPEPDTPDKPRTGYTG